MRSKASLVVISAETCLATCSSHDGDEKRCMIATEQRSMRTGGTTVGSGEVFNILRERDAILDVPNLGCLL